MVIYLTRIAISTQLAPKYFNREENPSAQSKNKNGDTGSPCRKPFEGVKKGNSSPFTFATSWALRWSSLEEERVMK